MAWTGVVVGLLLIAHTAGAEIYAWQDEHGVRHYTNLREEIPAAYRDGAEVVVTAAWTPKTPEAVAGGVPEPESRREAEVRVVPRPREAHEEARTVAWPAPVVAQGGNVEIQGPLAVSVPPPTVLWPGWGPHLITTSFDRGRTRHLTLRLLAEEQRWISEQVGWLQGVPAWPVFAGGPRPPCVAWRTCSVR